MAISIGLNIAFGLILLYFAVMLIRQSPYIFVSNLTYADEIYSTYYTKRMIQTTGAKPTPCIFKEHADDIFLTVIVDLDTDYEVTILQLDFVEEYVRQLVPKEKKVELLALVQPGDVERSNQTDNLRIRYPEFNAYYSKVDPIRRFISAMWRSRGKYIIDSVHLADELEIIMKEPKEYLSLIRPVLDVTPPLYDPNNYLVPAAASKNTLLPVFQRIHMLDVGFGADVLFLCAHNGVKPTLSNRRVGPYTRSIFCVIKHRIVSKVIPLYYRYHYLTPVSPLSRVSPKPENHQNNGNEAANPNANDEHHLKTD